MGTRTENQEAKIIVAHSSEQLSVLRPDWEKLRSEKANAHPNADYDRFLVVAQSADNTRTPLVIAIYEDEKPVFMMGGYRSEHRLHTRFGYRTLFAPKLETIQFVYGAMLGVISPTNSRILLSAFPRLFYSTRADAFFFNHLDTDSFFYRLLRSSFSGSRTSFMPEEDPHYWMTLPDSIDDVYARFSKKRRYNLKREIRMVSALDGFEIRRFCGTRDLEQGLSLASDVSRRTYQHALGKGFENDDVIGPIVRLSAEKDWLRIYVLFVESKPSAFLIGLKYGETFYLEWMGYDPDWAKYSLGTCLLVKLIEDCCEDQDVKAIDFGFGDAWYKQQFSTEHCMEASTYIFPLRLYPLTVNFTNALVRAAGLTARFVVRRIGIEQKIKTWWRKSVRAE